jgi:hypothetical protein
MVQVDTFVIAREIRRLESARTHLEKESEKMALEDFTDPEVAIVAAVAAAVFSPKVRGWLRRGAVYSMAGMLVAGDAISLAARGIGKGVQHAGETSANSAQNTANQANTSSGGPGETFV